MFSFNLKKQQLFHEQTSSGTQRIFTDTQPPTGDELEWQKIATKEKL